MKSYYPNHGIVRAVTMRQEKNPNTCAQEDAFVPTPIVLMSPYRDNIYLALSNIPDKLRPQILHVVDTSWRKLYNIPLKWESHDAMVVWGEAQVNCIGDRVSLNQRYSPDSGSAGLYEP